MGDPRSNLYEKFEPFGKFIATHGLAVFLVIFWTIEMYPNSRDEREDWIRGITELENTIDPKNRPLNSQQAHAIADFLFQSFSKELGALSYDNRLEINLVGSDQEFIKFTIGEDSFELFLEESYEDQVNKFNELIDLKKSFLEQEIDLYIEKGVSDAIRNSRVLAGRLIVFKYGDSDLYGLWSDFLKAKEEWIKKSLSDAYMNESMYPFEQDFLTILSKHRGYKNDGGKLKPTSVSGVVDQLHTEIEFYINNK